jgi:CheY-like chemotaxis protein
VLVVENDPIVADALRAFLLAHGCTIECAASRGEIEALAEASGWPDCAILDDMLGHTETGLDLARWLSQFIDRRRLLIATGNADPARIEELSLSGFAFLRKPVPGDALRYWLTQDPRSAALPPSTR